MALRDLHLDYNQIEDISALKDSRSLTDLSLIGNRITDISALSGFSLRTANVSLNRVRDLSPIFNPDLVRLGAAINEITSIEGIEQTAISNLVIQFNPLRDIEPLRHFAPDALRYVDISGTEVTDLTPLQNQRLQVLRASGSQITSLNGIAMEQLEELFVHQTALDRLDLSQAKNLKHCTIYDSQIRAPQQIVLPPNLDRLQIYFSGASSTAEEADAFYEAWAHRDERLKRHTLVMRELLGRKPGWVQRLEPYTMVLADGQRCVMVSTREYFAGALNISKQWGFELATFNLDTPGVEAAIMDDLSRYGIFNLWFWQKPTVGGAGYAELQSFQQGAQAGEDLRYIMEERMRLPPYVGQVPQGVVVGLFTMGNRKEYFLIPDGYGPAIHQSGFYLALPNEP